MVYDLPVRSCEVSRGFSRNGTQIQEVRDWKVLFLGSSGCGEDRSLGSGQEGYSLLFKVKALSSMGSICGFFVPDLPPSLCVPILFSRSESKGRSLGAFWPSITSTSHPPSVWRRQMKGKRLVEEGQDEQ
jgi:hypothetical protein